MLLLSWFELKLGKKYSIFPFNALEPTREKSAHIESNSEFTACGPALVLEKIENLLLAISFLSD